MRAAQRMGAELGKRANDSGAEEARRVGTRKGGAGGNPAPRDRRLWDAFALAGLGVATLLFAQRPSFGVAVGEETRPQRNANVVSATDVLSEPLPAAIELNTGGTWLRVRPLSRAEASEMRAQGMPGGGLRVLAAAGRSAAAITAGDVIVGLCGQMNTADAARLIAALEDSRTACVRAAGGGSVTERHLGDRQVGIRD